MPMTEFDGPVVVAYDGSAAAREAISAAGALLARRRALVLTVWDSALSLVALATPPDIAMAPIPDPDRALDLDQELEQHAERVAGEGVELARSLGVEAEPRAVANDGDIAEAIINFARAEHAAVIVIGSRGLTGLRARLEGSTSKKVVTGADCPVIVVHARDGA